MSALDDFIASSDLKVQDIEKLNESGSGRVYYRLFTPEKSFILTQNDNIQENESFFYLSNLFLNLNAFVPSVLHISDDRSMYIQDDLGDESLLELRPKTPERSDELYRLGLQKLSHLQIGAHQVVDYSKISGSSSFDKMLVLRDLFYFKNYFLDLTDIRYDQDQLLAEFEEIAQALATTNYRYFMFRDFQGRNIMVHEDKPFFIDFQDGMEGPIAYDLVSLLWQAKAKLTDEEKHKYYIVYLRELKKLLPTKFDKKIFEKDYKICVLLRVLQVLGAYGKLGIMQQKPHFKESLQLGIKNLKKIAEDEYLKDYPTLRAIAQSVDKHQLPKKQK